MSASQPHHSAIIAWLDHLDQTGKSPHTLAAYRRALAHFVQWSETTYGQTFDPAQIIGRDVADWRAFQQTVEQAKPATINQRLTALSRFCAWAVAEKIMASDPSTHTKSLAPEPRHPKGLAEPELRRLLRAVHAGGNARDVAMIELLAGTGLRVSELLALKVGDVDIHARSGKVTVRKGKHGNYRTVPLTSPVRTAVETYLDTHPGHKNPKAALWLGERGALRDRSAITRILEKYALVSKLEQLGPHSLRHTFATRYLDANPGDLRGLAALLGHDSLDTVMIYTEPREEELARRVERVENGG